MNRRLLLSGEEIMKFHYTAISVLDLNVSLKFYKDILGFNVVREVLKISGPVFEAIDLPAGSSCWLALLAAGHGSFIQLSQFSPKGKLPGPDSSQSDIGLIHVGFRVTQIEKLYEELSRKGVKLNFSVLTPEEG
jgi:catechol 2,3-dioxygenase-like lactoylglutathione lyase family enzyme